MAAMIVSLRVMILFCRRTCQSRSESDSSSIEDPPPSAIFSFFYFLIYIFYQFIGTQTKPSSFGVPDTNQAFGCLWWGERRQWSHSFLGLPQICNLWEEEEAQPLHLLQSNLIMDCRFRRSRAVWLLRSIFRKRLQKYCFFMKKHSQIVQSGSQIVQIFLFSLHLVGTAEDESLNLSVI